MATDRTPALLTAAAPATPAAALPRNTGAKAAASRPRAYVYENVGVHRAGGIGITTITVPTEMYAHMLRLAKGSRRTVAAACLAASLEIKTRKLGATWSYSVRERALSKLKKA